MDEIWKEIPGWEGIYEASASGIIRSVPRWIVQRNMWGTTQKCWRKTVVLSQTTGGKGYLKVHLRGNGRDHAGAYVHQLVALAFLGQCPEGLEVCHNNGDKLDCRIENLRYGTPAENVADAVRHGRRGRGTRANRYRVDIDEAEVLKLRAEGCTLQQLARRLGVGTSTVSRIVRGMRFNAP